MAGHTPPRTSSMNNPRTAPAPETTETDDEWQRRVESEQRAACATCGHVRAVHWPAEDCKALATWPHTGTCFCSLFALAKETTDG